MKVTIVVPVRNEEKNIARLVDALQNAFKESVHEPLIHLVLDPSTDNSLAELKKVSKAKNVTYGIKKGTPGKGYSLIEGFEDAKTEIVALIDADLQYPPEAIPHMINKLVEEDLDVVVASRDIYATSDTKRKIISKLNKFILGKLLHGLDTDCQSGLKVFRKEIFNAVDKSDIGAWTFDMPLLLACKHLGYKIGNYSIEFIDRSEATSHVGIIKTSYQIGLSSLKLFIKKHVHYLPHPEDNTRTLTHYKGKKFETHNKLAHSKSALYSTNFAQKASIYAILLTLLVLAIFNPLLALQVIIATLTVIYFADFALSVYLTNKSIVKPVEIDFTQDELDAINDRDLPIYTVLSPLYKESEILPHFVEAISNLSYPKEKLDVLLLLEEDDQQTIDAANQLDLPDYFRTIIVPHSMPKTKPKACNYGLLTAKGEILTIYDAEDKPDPWQLKKAYLALKNGGEKLVCVQGKLNYFNKHHNFLTRLFTAEYSLWFELILPSLQSINTIIPLGGTSNHFKTDVLRKLEGWDPFNVTEDCDLGVRLFKQGYKTAIINSVTLEEANSNVNNWIRQRSRWLKGYLQTYLVHMRDPITFAKQHKFHSLLFQLIIGLRISFILINPIMWLLTLSYFLFYNQVGLFIESLFPTAVFYLAAISLVFGNFFYIYNYMVGLAKHGHWDLIKYVFFVPFYWVILSIAAIKAFYQLVINPHYWEKTNHGLHFRKRDKYLVKLGLSTKPLPSILKTPSLLVQKITTKKIPIVNVEITPQLIAGGTLVAGSIIANLLNFIYNAVLSRSISLEDFGTLSLIGNLLLIVAIPFSSLSRTVSHKSGYLLGENSKNIRNFWKNLQLKTFIIGIGVFGVWLLVLPLLKEFFNTNSSLPFLLFSPVILIGLLGATNAGYISGNQRFTALGLMVMVEAIAKLAIAILIVWLGHTNYIYLAITLSICLTFIVGLTYANKITPQVNEVAPKTEEIKFPAKFYLSSILIGFSLVSFISFDLILAKHYLNPTDAGLYSLVSLTGKMIYLIGTMLSQFIVPVISKLEGSKKNSQELFSKLFTISTTASFFFFLIFGYFGKYTGPLLFGEKIIPAVSLLPLYGMGIFLFTISTILTSYNQTKQRHIFSYASFIVSIGYIIAISLFHSDLAEIVLVTTFAGAANLAIISLLHFIYAHPKVLECNFKYFLGLFNALPTDLVKDPSKETILIFNWRDTSHKWAGGAEVYVYELGKRLVNDYNVIIFCGNDLESPLYENLDGIAVFRRGGFVTVYIWAMFYYLFKLRKHVDLIIDSENGVPFFSPLFSRKPVIGLVHHVHSTVFDENLPKPLAMLAKFLETSVMPFVYRNCKMITVSKSSKQDMEALGFGKNSSIDIVHPGIETEKFKPSKKATKPTILYLGRIKRYKSIDKVIRAMPLILKEKKNAVLKIAGSGDDIKNLRSLVEELNLGSSVKFLGHVTEEEKIKLLGEAWVFAYPSSMEGWGISAIEANACGTPVVAANVPGLRDSVKENQSGYLVKDGTTKEYAEKLIEVLSNKPLRDKLKKSSIEWANNYSWESSTSHLNEILGRVSEEKSFERSFSLSKIFSLLHAHK